MHNFIKRMKYLTSVTSAACAQLTLNGIITDLELKELQTAEFYKEGEKAL
jgi:hypothetical protein